MYQHVMPRNSETSAIKTCKNPPSLPFDIFQVDVFYIDSLCMDASSRGDLSSNETIRSSKREPPIEGLLADLFENSLSYWEAGKL